MVWIDDGSASARFEIFQWQPTLWGGVALVRLRGTLGQPPRVQTLLKAETPHPSAIITDLCVAGYTPATVSPIGRKQ